MSEDLRILTCEEFQGQIAELIASGADIENHLHVKACAICRQLLRDIENIAESARHFHFGTDESGTDDWPETT
jgi:hypothetical protein